MEAHLSPRELAAALGVSESSIKRWVDGGELAAVRTAGGHRRIPRTEAIRFSRQKRLVPSRPELLSLETAAIEDSGLDEQRRAAALHRALLDDDRGRAIGLLVSGYLAGQSVAALCDGPIRVALERIGEIWKHDARGILYEHRAVDTCLHAIAALRAALPAVPDGAPVALGAGGSDDPYLLPGLMCAAVLAEAGYRDVNLGPRTPVVTVAAAVTTYRPLLVWHTASTGGDDETARELADLASAIAAAGGANPPRLVAGGRALDPRKAPAGTVILAGMAQLEDFARGLVRRDTP